jgi:hypothetical protein
MPFKELRHYDVDDVAIWLGCIGLGTKAEAFREHAVDGDMLLTLTTEDLTGDLDMSNLQARKVLTSIESTKEIIEAHSLADVNDTAYYNKIISDLEAENASLKAKLNPHQVQPAPIAQATPVQAAPVSAPPQPKPRQPTVLGGAGTGAARGAVRGAIAGGMYTWKLLSLPWSRHFC